MNITGALGIPRCLATHALTCHEMIAYWPQLIDWIPCVFAKEGVE